jgi:peptide/nickel transport system substrate-binding protein
LPSTDPAMSGRILDDVGWTRGEGITRAAGGASLVLPLLIVDTTAQRALADEIAQQWSALGIDVPIEAVSAGVFAERMTARRFTLTLRTFAPLTDPDLFAWWHSTQAAEGANAAGLVDREIDRLLEQSRTTLDLTRRIETTNALAERWAALLPSLPLYQSVLVYDLNPSIEPTQLDATRLLATPSARFDGISAWTFGEH